MSIDIFLPSDIIERFDEFLRSGEYSLTDDKQSASDHWSKRTYEKKETFSIHKDFIRINFGKDIGMGDQYVNSFSLKDKRIRLNHTDIKTKKYSSDSGIYKPSIKRRLLIYLLRKMGIYDGVSFDPIRHFNQSWGKHSESDINFLNYKNIISEYGLTQDTSIFKSFHIYNSIISGLRDLKISEINHIIEIGPGVGSLARLIKSNFPSHKSVYIDLPTSIPFSFLNLIIRFPKSEFCLPNEIKNTSNLEKIDFLFLTNNQSFPSLNYKFDLAINTMSFQEMNFSEINKYFSLLREILSKNNLFYCLNAVEKIMTKDDKVESIKFSEYPWSEFDRNFFYRLSNVELGRTKKPFFERASCLNVNY